MGGLITADPWLLTLALRGLPQHKIAGALLRAQIITAARSEHLMDLGSEQVRRAVVHSAAWGAVANVPVRCSRCGCIAGLPSWVRFAQKSRHEQDEARAYARTVPRPWVHTYMQMCPGEQYARDLAEITSLPAERSE